MFFSMLQKEAVPILTQPQNIASLYKCGLTITLTVQIANRIRAKADMQS